ncbi:MAG: substrate-binding domain-containing protein [Bacillota bacterium]
MKKLAAALCALMLLVACSPASSKVLILATTTSTADTGLLDVLNAEFARLHPGWTVKIVAVGTGEALKLGERKDCDVLLVHARESEEAFLAAGFGVNRRDVMYNDFVLLGPGHDPAGVKGAASLVEALQLLGNSSFLFVSRGDNSGTHRKEIELWKQAGLVPGGESYLSTGQGMGETLRIASDKAGYTLSDRGTYLATSNLDLAVVFQGDPLLRNEYGVIEVKGAKNPDGARAYAEFLVSSVAQGIIADFGKDRFGQPLFYPNAGR